MRPEDRVRIAHMLDTGAEIEGFVAGRSREDLDRDRMLLHALVRLIEILGEAASGISTETRAASPEVPWRVIIAMRNRLIHGYADVDANVVWTTATIDVPPVLPALRALVDRESGG